MLPIAGYPGIVTKHLKYFQGVFSRPQLKHALEYLTGLMVCSNRTVTGINDSFIGHRDQSVKNRFLSSSGWSEEALEKARITLLLKQLKNAHPKQGFLLIDDTIAHKYGPAIQGVGIYYDHALHRYTLGHQLITSHFIGRTIHFPVDFRLYQRKQNLKDQKDFKTKIELAQELLQEAIDKGLPFFCVILDSWYCNKKVTNFIQERDKDWVAACKSNRLLLMNGKKISLTQYALSLPQEAFKKVEVEVKGKKHTFWYFTKSVTMTNLGRVRVVITYDNQDLEGSPSFYLTNKTSWEVKKILGSYLKRWTIETFYRDSKQNLGLEDCELRNIKGIKRHWYLMFLAYSLLQLGSTDTTLSRWLKANIITVGQRCRLATVETLRSFILWVLKQSRNNLDHTEILQMSLSSRSELETAFC